MHRTTPYCTAPHNKQLATVASFKAKEFRRSLQYSVLAESLVPHLIEQLRDPDPDRDPDLDGVTEGRVGVSTDRSYDAYTGTGADTWARKSRDFAERGTGIGMGMGMGLGTGDPSPSMHGVRPSASGEYYYHLLNATHTNRFNRIAELRIHGTEHIHYFKGERRNSFSALPYKRADLNSPSTHSKKSLQSTDYISRFLANYYSRRDNKDVSADGDGDGSGVIDVICTVYSTAATLRSHLLQNTQLQFTPRAVEKKELGRRDELLSIVARPYCTRHDGSTGPTVEFATEALSALWTSFTQKYLQENLDLLSFIDSRGNSNVLFFCFQAA